MDPRKKASEIVAVLDLKPHPDGGFYLETFRDFSISLPKSQLPPHCQRRFTVFKWIQVFARRVNRILNPPLCPELVEEISQLSVLISNLALTDSAQDVLSWRWTGSSRFSTRSAYDFLIFDGFNDNRTPQLWTLKIPLRVKLFMWLAMRNKLLTSDNLCKRGWNGPSICALCGANSETLEHLFMQYKVARPVSSAIYFLLPSGGIAHLHRIPCAETWHFYSGEPLTVFELYNDGRIKLTVVGPDLEAGHRPQYTVPPDVWFGAFPTFDVESCSADGSVLVKAPKRDPELHYSFVGVTCAPAFQYDDNELATRAELKNLAPSAEPFINYLIP